MPHGQRHLRQVEKRTWALEKADRWLTQVQAQIPPFTWKGNHSFHRRFQKLLYQVFPTDQLVEE